MGDDGETIMDKFSITITAKARHGKLWELQKKFGSVSALARYLEMSPSDLGEWVNLKKVPKRMRKERKDKLERKLVRHGLLLEDLFPIELTDDVLNKPKDFEVTRDISLQLLGQSGGIRLLNAPDENIGLREQVKLSLSVLTPREEKVIKLRFGLDGEDEHTLDETGDVLELTRERIRQIEAKAIRKMKRERDSDSECENNSEHFRYL